MSSIVNKVLSRFTDWVDVRHMTCNTFLITVHCLLQYFWSVMCHRHIVSLDCDFLLLNFFCSFNKELVRMIIAFLPELFFFFFSRQCSGIQPLNADLFFHLLYWSSRYPVFSLIFPVVRNKRLKGAGAMLMHDANAKTPPPPSSPVCTRASNGSDGNN